MWGGGRSGERREVMNKLIAVAIDRDKGSQSALKWATDYILNRGQTVILIHVINNNNKHHSSFSSIFPLSPPLSTSSFSTISDVTDENGSMSGHLDPYIREMFLPFRCFCTRKDIHCEDVVLENTDVVKALVDYVTESAIEILVLGGPSKNAFLRRFKAVDISGSVLKEVPDFCTVYVISKGKISSTRAAARPAPAVSPLRSRIQYRASIRSDQFETAISHATRLKGAPKLPSLPPYLMHNNMESIKSPFSHRNGPDGKPYMYGQEFSLPNADADADADAEVSSVGSYGRPSVDRSMFPNSFNDSVDMNRSPCRSSFSELDNHSSSYDLLPLNGRDTDTTTPEFSTPSLGSDQSPKMDDVEAEMRRLKMELKQIIDKYSTACKEAITAKETAKELQQWKMEEEQRLEESRLAEEAALAIIEREREKSKAAIEAAQAAQRIAQIESKKRIKAEMKALKEAEAKSMVLDRLVQSDTRYRKYSIEDIEAATNFFSESNKIGEGGYGPVYKCYLDHTPVAVKVLRPDAAHGRSQFQQEVEVLSCMRHPNMVLLLGACPEYGCLVYEYMSNGSLEDCLFHKGKRLPLSWQQRFQIAADIGTGLLFLHQTKPEPLVHRDLKPANILLDRNYVSKISDVGLARLVPPSTADSVTQYRMTSAAGTFCYIDPEYQQTGMLGVKSDVYSLGIMFLQIITAKSPMGLTHHVGQAIEEGTLSEMLDPAVPDWPIDETMVFAKLSLQCAELRRKDRPDLGKVVLPELERLRSIADKCTTCDGSIGSHNHSQVSLHQDDMGYPTLMQS